MFKRHNGVARQSTYVPPIRKMYDFSCVSFLVCKTYRYVCQLIRARVLYAFCAQSAHRPT